MRRNLVRLDSRSFLLLMLLILHLCVYLRLSRASASRKSASEDEEGVQESPAVVVVTNGLSRNKGGRGVPGGFISQGSSLGNAWVLSQF